MLLERGYRHLNLPAIAEREEDVSIGPGRVHRRVPGDLLNPAREDMASLERTRREMGPAVFSAQYQQNPVVPEGNAIRMEWFRRYTDMPERLLFTKVVQSWDTGMSAAPTSDYSACTTWGFHGNRWYLVDVYRNRLDYPDLKREVIRLWKRWTPDRVLIEDAGAGKLLAQELRVRDDFKSVLCPARIDKETRFTACFAEIEAGKILLPNDAPWLNDFCNELRAFPVGKNDDQVDSLSQFINHQKKHWSWVTTTYNSAGRVVSTRGQRPR